MDNLFGWLAKGGPSRDVEDGKFRRCKMKLFGSIAQRKTETSSADVFSVGGGCRVVAALLRLCVSSEKRIV